MAYASLEKQRETTRTRLKVFRERRGGATANNRIWNSENREKYLAHKAVEGAIKAGRLVKRPCAICGTNDLVHAHHEDYSRQLDVIWFCPLHHAERHAQIKSGNPPDISHLIESAIPAWTLRKKYEFVQHISWVKRDKIWSVKIVRTAFQFRGRFKSLADAIVARDNALKQFAELALGRFAQDLPVNLSRARAMSGPALFQT